MTVTLGFDTATQATAVGLALADGTTLQERDDPVPGERPGHATRLLPLAASLLRRAGVQWSELERVAVGVGPGTFTGLRIGVATARGLAQSLGIPLVGVSSLHALAAFALTHADGPLDGVMSVIDARRSEAFAALYRPGHTSGAGEEPQSDGLDRLAGATDELLAAVVVPPEELAGLLVRNGADVPGERWLAVGDGAIRYSEQLLDAGLELPEQDSPLHRVTGAAICALSQATRPGDPKAISPDYLRRPDAEIALEKAPT